MRLSFNNHAIEIKAWETKAEMLHYISNCDSGSLLLGEDAEQEIQFYSAIIRLGFSGLHCFGIGICSEGHGLLPHLLLLPNSDILLFGFNREVNVISFEDKSLKFKIKLDSLFSSFWYLTEHNIILVFHEIGVLAINEKGEVLWRYEKDILVDAHIDNNDLCLKFIDGSLNCLDITTFKTYEIDIFHPSSNLANSLIS